MSVNYTQFLRDLERIKNDANHIYDANNEKVSESLPSIKAVKLA